MIDIRKVIVTGRLIKRVELKDELSVDIGDPKAMIKAVQANIKADIFTFIQRFTDPEPRYNYSMKWDNVAALPISSFDYWWTKQIKDKPRNLARKSGKRGVIIKTEDFNDDLVKGVMGIYNETHIRRGRPFSHYGEDFETVKRNLSDRLLESIFITAYHGNELIGFVKLTNVGTYAIASGTIAKIKHRDKSPMNALIAKAVEVCAEKKYPFLVYGKFVYGNRGVDTLSSFKAENGFKKYDFPRYYIPLSIKGKIILKLGLHDGIIGLLPQKLIRNLIYLRNKWYSRKSKS